MDILKCAENAGFEVAKGEIFVEDFRITGDLHVFARLVLEEAKKIVGESLDDSYYLNDILEAIDRAKP